MSIDSLIGKVAHAISVTDTSANTWDQEYRNLAAVAIEALGLTEEWGSVNDDEGFETPDEVLHSP